MKIVSVLLQPGIVDVIYDLIIDSRTLSMIPSMKLEHAFDLILVDNIDEITICRCKFLFQ